LGIGHIFLPTNAEFKHLTPGISSASTQHS
jgi:hypothetical protein